MEEPHYKEVCIDDRLRDGLCPSDLKCAICRSIYVNSFALLAVELCMYMKKMPTCSLAQPIEMVQNEVAHDNQHPREHQSANFRKMAPVMLSCGHSFCASCADGWLRKRHTCPTCRGESSEQPIKNIVLGQIVEEHIRILAEDGPVPTDPLGSDDDEDSRNISASSSTPAETFVRGIVERLSKRIRKPSNKLTGTNRRLNSLTDVSPVGVRAKSPVFVRSNTVRFASCVDRTPLNVMAARKRLGEEYVYTGLTPEESSPVVGRCERQNINRVIGNQYLSPSRRSEQSVPASDSPEPTEMKRGGVIRRSLGVLRKSVRSLRKESGKSQQEESISKEENEKTHEENKPIGDRQSFGRMSIRKSIMRRLRGWKNGKAEAATATGVDTAAADEEKGPRLVSAARILVIDSTANLELAAFLRSLGDISSDSLPHIQVLTSEERRELPLLREEYEGLTLLSILYKGDSDLKSLTVLDIYEGRREMSGEVEHCTILLKCCQAVLLFCASDPSSALQANSDFRYVQKERKEMNLSVLPMWTVHAVRIVDTPPRGRNGSTSSGGAPTHIRPRPLSVAQDNRLSTSELSTRLLPTKQIQLQLSNPPRQEFVRSIQELLSELKSMAVPIE